MTKQMAFYFNASICSGCKACMTSCKDKNSLPVGVNWRRVTEYGGGTWVPDPLNPGVMVPNNVFAYAISTACMHCQNPLCVEVCPTQAMYKRADGIVLIDAQKCVGCRYCQWACPYGAPSFNDTAGVMTKCNFCADLQDQGLNPACVDACVMRALEFGELDELRAKYGDHNEMAPLPSADITNPSFVMTLHRNAQPVNSQNGEIIALPEEV
jgi:anaerobic dimethyl sulfoxide reductase subunit B (iron-sulfur subunit)